MKKGLLSIVLGIAMVTAFSGCCGEEEKPVTSTENSADAEAAARKEAPMTETQNESEGETPKEMESREEEKEEPKGKEEKMGNPVVEIQTNMGTIKVELWPDAAPETVKNFMSYVDEKFYDGTVFHRVIPGFMIQGGGFNKEMKQKPTHEPVVNEAKTDVKNDNGTIAMARTNDVNSATAQFFINVKDNDFLNHRDETARGFGYCVFGKVTEGTDVVTKIENVDTTTRGPYADVPVTPVIIESIRASE